jgi:hypothetical protein
MPSDTLPRLLQYFHPTPSNRLMARPSPKSRWAQIRRSSSVSRCSQSADPSGGDVTAVAPDGAELLAAGRQPGLLATVELAFAGQRFAVRH